MKTRSGHHPSPRSSPRTAMAGIADKKYTFEVAKDANKIEIAKAVEELFGVKVAKVNTMQRAAASMSRMGMHEGYTAAWKKADRHPDRRIPRPSSSSRACCNPMPMASHAGFAGNGRRAWQRI